MFHIHVETHDKKTEEFIQQSPNSTAWEIYNSEKMKKLRRRDVCCNDLKACIEPTQYLYNDIQQLHWIHTNKINYNKSQVCEDKRNTNVSK